MRARAISALPGRLRGITLIELMIVIVVLGVLVAVAYPNYRDFVQVRFAGVPFFDPFPSFNVADAAITVGAILLIIDSIFFSGREDAPTRKGG